MSDEPKKQRTEADAELEREIREGRKFNLAEAIGRLAGPGAMKGVSPVPRMEQAAAEIHNWLHKHLRAGQGELHTVLLRGIEGSDLLLNGFERPLVVLAAYCQQVLDSDFLITELVRETDVEWGRTQLERPYFEKEGMPPDPDDPYSIQSVRIVLLDLLEQLAKA